MSERPETFEEWRQRTSPGTQGSEEPSTPRDWVNAAGTFGAFGLAFAVLGGLSAAVGFAWLAGGSLLMAGLRAKLPEVVATKVHTLIYGTCFASWIAFRAITNRFNSADSIGLGVGAGILLLMWMWSRRSDKS
jgi:hypothetical protein